MAEADIPRPEHIEKCPVNFITTALGYSLLSAWSQAFFSNRFADAALAAGSSILTVHAVGSACAVLAALVVMLFARRLAPLRMGSTSVWTACLLAATSTAGIALAGRGALAPGIVMPLNALACAASVWLSLAWFERLAGLGVRGALGCFGVSAVAGGALYFVTMALHAAASAALLTILPPVSVVLLRLAPPLPDDGAERCVEDAQCTGDALPAKNAQPSVDAQPVPWGSFVPLAAIVGLANYANGTFLNLSLATTALAAPTLAGIAVDSVTHMLTTLAAVGLAALCTGRRTRMAFCASILFILAASLLTFAWDQAPIQPLATLVHVGVELMGFLAIAALIAIAQSGRASATLLFSAYVLFQFCGTLVGQVSSTALADNRPLTALLLMVALVLMLLLAFLSHDTIARPEAAHASAGAQPTADAAAFAPAPAPDPLRALAAAHGLSPRELDVARLWVAGHNSAFIEETLGISKYTVRTHLKNIYAKTGTANKEELIRLAEESRG